MRKLFVVAIWCIFILTTNYAAAQTNSTKIQDVVYTAKFVCGSISDNLGPLRPGRYDTSISILNKKTYQVNMLWNAVINDGPSSNVVLRNIEPEKSLGISCKDIKKAFGINTNEIVEGFTLIKVPLASLSGFSNQQTIIDAGDALDMLEVQVFYTANALETLPYEIIVEKIAFYIIQDGTGKIPKDSFRKLLDMTIPAKIGEVSDTESKVKQHVEKKFGLNKDDMEKIRIRIKDISVGAGALLDDHAISLHVVRPQFN